MAANVNYLQQSVFSDVNQFGMSDAHIFSPRLVNEATFSYLTSRSGGGAVTHIAPRDQGVNVDVGNDGRGMSLPGSGSINLPIRASTPRTIRAGSSRTR